MTRSRSMCDKDWKFSSDLLSAAEGVAWISMVRNVLLTSRQNLFEVKAYRYWLDFVVSLMIAYTTGYLFLTSPALSWQQLLAYPIAITWIYRLSSLVHEVAHLPTGHMRLFKIVWNLAAGVVLLSPSPFFTHHHREHHAARWYGTVRDPEYIANVFTPGSWRGLIRYALIVAIFPVIVWLRFIATPLTYLHSGLRDLVLTRASALTMNVHYERKHSSRPGWSFVAIEWLCFVRACALLVLVLLGSNPPERLLLVYLLALGALSLNQLRLVTDHHLNSSGEVLGLEDHILDSCNYTSQDLLTRLLFPFAIRYHALHHLFPSLPYHNLAAAHRRLVQCLPADSPYRGLDQGSWWQVARHLLKPRTPRPAWNASMAAPVGRSY